MALPTPITHIVLFKYRANITWTDFQTHFDTFRALQTRCIHPSTGKPYMLSMRMGQNSSWEPFNKGMTHGFVLEFASQEHLDYYLLQDSVHLEFSRNAGPLIEDSVVVDIKDGVLFGPKPRKPVGLGAIWKDAMPEKVIVRTLLLEGGNELQAGGEIFAEGALSWAQDLKSALTQSAPAKTVGKSDVVNGVNGA
ncbi:hypothetical protein E8E12_006426 [Didymella heteroderae]|uniref:Stress-response A/B barrel domain-containing protein n=1 Tax=Didymella heteroderae TaxID=1769908 RepID=A0A9P5BZK4_9PLEO|nr:hypothetical protein E8E12_006426 [Didymella heteroderae]